MKAISTIDSSYNSAEIVKKINFGLSEKFKKKIKKVINPYGDGNSSKRILDILHKMKINDKLIIKKITY